LRYLTAIFGLRGRLSRGAFFLRLVLILVAFALLDVLLQPLLGPATVWVLNLPTLWALAAAGARRLHDRGLSARWLAAGLVPVLGALWLLWQFCRKGAPGDSRFGRDPLAPRGDFLVVGG
jgi:uncharacterized membrane protein YhaH (DUF805 family)